VLALAPDKLYFLMYLPQRAFVVDITSITVIEHARWFLKKTRGRELLLIRFNNPAGERHAMAWLVPDLH
jgi:hypothetical protein